MNYQWLDWAKRIQALAQAGLEFSKDIYDIERFEELRTISAEIMAVHTNLEIDIIEDLFTNETGYQTPKVDIRGVVFRNEKILMVKENYDDKWSLPGGFCDIGFSPKENIIKEIKEESGFDVRAERLLALLDSNLHPHPPQPYHYYKIFILCEIIGGEANIGIETNDVQFFSENHLPPLSLNRNTESQIKMLFEFLRDPHKQVILD
ncbi:NUDIX hydrolase [Lederbergia wuyishanensis]|uniref:ADP-ribose pyrophosphatase YjhB (NUDIX family) n=1 Tax=Lederbergia wuyishanensis TaxID=1347903 RepID=A0ABU0D7T2_9BACI|nr:NUDIX hydrolase [Lederbergia wuyishanensis]MCJ8009143.1 NUDIX hydrolase [Lederbergia wuyishanensis]MDQ0344483.1 ADP-ribose pyrophosphatase YjhB (NUDIX family) [Lederbergia wuyishanensis]